MYTRTYNIHRYVYKHTHNMGMCVYAIWVLICTYIPKCFSCCGHCSHRPHSISSHTDCPGAVGFTLLPFFLETDKRSFTTCGPNVSLSSRLSPFMTSKTPESAPGMWPENSVMQLQSSNRRDRLWGFDPPAKNIRHKGGHIFSHDSVAEPLSPWAVCFKYWLQSSDLSIVCREGLGSQSISPSFPQLFCDYFPENKMPAPLLLHSSSSFHFLPFLPCLSSL